ncbi:MAG: hypothetical protein OEW89_00845 [Gammaproteobacteria bacterium]|nr:hypothetical protein [Gammaproteobacteria bacterium]MDH5594648.1 hypothetical protein [Gammaproteobacteria bacterium]
MTERTLRLLVGLLILIALYLELPELIFGLIVFMLFEGITNLRLPILLSKIQGIDNTPQQHTDEPEQKSKFSFEAERAMRFAASALLGVSYFVLNEHLWFIPWFMGFAFLGAGISGVCPMLMGFKQLGFK